MTKTNTPKPHHSFSHFLTEPLVATAFIVFALIALMFSLFEFSQALNGY